MTVLSPAGPRTEVRPQHAVERHPGSTVTLMRGLRAPPPNQHMLPSCIGRIAFVVTLVAPIRPLVAQPASAPPANVYYPGLAYDAARSVTVMFGGIARDTTYSPRAGTWEWDGSRWQLRDVTGPSARAAHGMVYDSRRHRIVLFGGAHKDEPLGDTWEYDGVAWTRVSTWGPAPRMAFAMAYDSARGRVVLHGGSQGVRRTVFEDTWEWDGATWMRVATGGLPQNSFHRMAYDTRRQRIVSFGGRGAGGETWEWDGRTWTRVHTSGPPARDHHAIAYDAKRGRVVVFGGSSQPGGTSYFRDLWAWDGSRWTLLGADENISPRGGLPGMTYDARRDRLVLVGGGGSPPAEQHAGTWEWDGRTWRRSDSLG